MPPTGNGIIRRSPNQRKKKIILRIAMTKCCKNKRVAPVEVPGSLDFICTSCGRRWIVRRQDVRDIPQPIRMMMTTLCGRRKLGRMLTQGIVPR